MLSTTRSTIAWAARNEITEHLIYQSLARQERLGRNQSILREIAAEERSHYERWKTLLGHEVQPSYGRIWFFIFLVRILGLSFGLRYMEKGERLSARVYRELAKTNPEAMEVVKDEQRHEGHLLNLIDERRLIYVSSFVLGLNDALVELTGALAGLTLALQDTKLISVVGLITGIAASFAMASAEYLSTKEEEARSAVRAGLTTGTAYLFTVVLLILPYLLLSHALAAFTVTLGLGIIIITSFTFYTAIVKHQSFRRKFLEMMIISLGVALFNVVIGYIIKRFFKV